MGRDGISFFKMGSALTVLSYANVSTKYMAGFTTLPFFVLFFFALAALKAPCVAVYGKL